MDVHSLIDAPDMNLHDLPAELELQYSPTDMSGPFGAVTAQEHDDHATGSDISMVDEQQQTRPIDDLLQTLYNTYHTSYVFDITKISAHKKHARDFAFALLQRHYPASRQYRVEATALGPLCKYGINFILKEPYEPESDIDTPPSKKKKSAPKQNKHGHSDLMFHNIEPENMVAFAVKKGVVEVNDGVETLTWRAHTYLVILLDDLSTFPRWSRDNVNHRGDVLSDLSGVIGRIRRGHGILFFGPRLELYSYDANDAKLPVKPYQSPNWKMDMRITSLAEVDEVLRNFVRQEPMYKDGH